MDPPVSPLLFSVQDLFANDRGPWVCRALKDAEGGIEAGE